MIRIKLLLSAITLLIALPAMAADFDHAVHLANPDTPSCGSCHQEEAESIKPEESVCLNCHEEDFLGQVAFPGLKTHGPTWSMNHRPMAKAKSIDCAACHEQEFCMDCHKAGFADEMGKLGNSMTNVHRSDFTVSHPIAARTDPQLCATCHERKFCVECHDQFAPADLAVLSHRRGFTDGTLGGAHLAFDDSQCEGCHINSVLPTHQWSNQHAREARKNLVTCQACHPEGNICLKCHSAISGLKINPHPDNWGRNKDRIDKASGGATCRRCH